MKNAKDSQKQMHWSDGVFVLSFLPALFMGMFIFVKGFEVKPQPWHDIVFGIAVAGLVISGPVLVWRKLRKDVYPDLLRFYTGTPFESAGIQVVPLLSPPAAPPGGVVRVGVFFQNRYDAPSTLIFRLRYPSGTVAVQRTQEVAPGEAGFFWKEVPVPDTLPPGPAPLKLELSGTRGSGREVRFTEGKIVRSDASKALEVVALAVSTHHAHLADNEDVLPLQIAPEAPRGALSWTDGEGAVRLWIRGMPLAEQKAAMDRAMEIAGPRFR
jgi:hypothetical protein